jgi:hypothetical protein
VLIIFDDDGGWLTEEAGGAPPPDNKGCAIPMGSLGSHGITTLYGNRKFFVKFFIFLQRICNFITHSTSQPIHLLTYGTFFLQKVCHTLSIIVHKYFVI